MKIEETLRVFNNNINNSLEHRTCQHVSAIVIGHKIRAIAANNPVEHAEMSALRHYRSNHNNLLTRQREKCD